MRAEDWVEGLAPRLPSMQHEHAVEASRGRMAELGLAAYADARLDWSRAGAVFGSLQRRARSLSSSKRRFLMDQVSFLVRRERTISLLLDLAGLPESANRARVERARYLAAGVLYGGLRAEEIEWQGPFLDWEVVADPAHSLRGWVLQSVPSRAEQLARLGSLPDWLAERLLLLPDPAGLVRALNERGPLCLRANRPAGDRASLLEELEGAEACRLARDGLRLPGHSDAHALAPLKEGRADIQDEGSQLIAELCAPQAGERIIDACAGALGKSLALASLQQDQGSIVATDVRGDALRRGLKRARRAGYRSIRTVPVGSVRGPADLVLVDAPCSGTGALRRRPWTRWSMHLADLQRLTGEQSALLDRAAGWVAEGGRLVYATCSLLAEENDDVVEGFIDRHPDWRLAPASDYLGTERADQIGDRGVLRLLPHQHGTDGFYAAVLTRT
ncbi:MAG: RsmB/NOP family class I SAM-dependent RNA methyltransferase [Myxococcota bacterium]|nr:RsmB/NOP family class I SAM-dependent RNA methyltransferase [Myxococcota bacterium]